MLPSERALRRAIIDHLCADAALVPLLGLPARVHTRPPPDPVYPYLSVGCCEGEARPGEQVLTLTVVSEYCDLEESRAAARLVRASLERAGIPGLRIAFVDSFRGADWRLSLAVLRLRATNASGPARNDCRLPVPRSAPARAPATAC